MSRAEPSPPGQVTRRLPLARYAVITAGLSGGYGAVFALLADFRDRFGFTESEIGLFAAVGFFAGFAAQLGLSTFADRGHATLMIRVGLVCAVIGMGWMVFATELWQFVMARLLFGLSSGAAAPAIRRMVINADPARVGENLGRLTGADVGGFVLGPAMSAVLAEVGGVRLPFVVLTALYCVLVAAAGRLPAESGVAAADHGWPVRPLARIPGVQAALAAAVAFYITIGFFEATWALLLDDLGASTATIGISLSVFTIPMVLFAPLGGRVAQRRGHTEVVALSISLATVCTLAYGWIESLWVVISISMVHALADAFTMPANQVAVAVAAPRELSATGQGMLAATGTLVGGIAALASGGLYESSGPRAVYTIAAGAMAVFLGLSVFASRRAPATVG